MTKYEQLQKALEDEGKRLMQEFSSKVKNGDYALKDGGIGAIYIRPDSGEMHFFPIRVQGLNNNSARPDGVIKVGDIPFMTHIGRDLAILDQYIQKLISKKTKEDADIPF